MMKLRNFSLLKMDQRIHTGSLCILARRLHNLTVNIISLDIDLNIQIHHILRFFHRIIPKLLRDQICPLFRSKTPVHARCNICRHHRSLDRERAASAKRIHQNTILLPRCQHDQGCRKRLCQWRLARRETVTSLVQRITRSIDCYHHFILQQENAYRIACPILRKPVQMIGLLHTLHHRFLRDRLDIRRTEKLAFDR